MFTKTIGILINIETMSDLVKTPLTKTRCMCSVGVSPEVVLPGKCGLTVWSSARKSYLAVYVDQMHSLSTCLKHFAYVPTHGIAYAPLVYAYLDLTCHQMTVHNLVLNKHGAFFFIHPGKNFWVYTKTTSHKSIQVAVGLPTEMMLTWGLQ